MTGSSEHKVQVDIGLVNKGQTYFQKYSTVNLVTTRNITPQIYSTVTVISTPVEYTTESHLYLRNFQWEREALCELQHDMLFI